MKLWKAEWIFWKVEMILIIKVMTPDSKDLKKHLRTNMMKMEKQRKKEAVNI